MKKTIIALAIILSSGIAALSFNKKSEVKNVVPQINQAADLSTKAAPGYGNFKSNIANAD